MFHRNKILPLIILALLVSMAMIAYTIGNNDQNSQDNGSSEQQPSVAQEQIDEQKAQDNFGEGGVSQSESDDQPTGDQGTSVNLGLYTYDQASGLFKVGATVSGDGDVQSCLFRLSDQSNPTLEIETDVLPPTQTQQGCQRAIFDASKLHTGEDWIIEVRLLDENENALASLVETYRAEQ